MRTNGREVAACEQHVAVLMYHSVSEEASPLFRPYAISPARFREHMSVVAADGYRPITVTAYAEALARGGSPAHERAVVITFDDGFADFHSHALPVLADFRFSATVYVPSAFVGGTSRWLALEHETSRPVMSWGALAESVSAGVEIGSHSRTHADLDMTTAPRLRAEVIDSKRELEDRLQVPMSSFAYPFGHHSASVRAMVRDAGYTSGAGVRDLSSSGESVFCLNRWTVHGDMSAATLRQLLAVRSGRLAIARSDARALVSRALRRTGLKCRPATETAETV